MDTQENRGKLLRIVAGIVIVAVLGITLFLSNRDNTSEQEVSPSDAQTPTEIVQNGAQDGASVGDYEIGGNNDGSSQGGGTDENTEGTVEDLGNPLVPKRQEAPNPESTDKPEASRDLPAEASESYGAGDALDPKKQSLDTSAIIVSDAMFATSIAEGRSMANSLNAILKTHGTERAKEVGFVRWWNGSDNDHSDVWKNSLTTDSNILSSSTIKRKDVWANDMVRVRMEVAQFLNSRHEVTPLKPYTIDLYMKKVDGGWYLDVYDFPDGNYPSIY